ncbi:hypothetical protein [Chishuiella sp.]|uniref:hypothetical protein n=1 Tax=Chishuiella sp. TaxID=1969467 RepID=UPI0028B18A98|nr:hypothetical protein [Chishuiella sp.]
MATFISILILLLIFVILISTFFIVAVSDAKVKKNKEQFIFENLPDNIVLKSVIRYNIGRPQGKFLMMKSFQGSGVLYVNDNKVIFQDILNKEDHTFDLKTCKISWVENKINGITNAFKIADHEIIIFFYIDQGGFIFNTIEENISTSELFNRLKALKKQLKKAE